MRKIKHRLLGRYAVLGLSFLLVAYIAVEQVMMFNIRKSLEQQYGENYAILRLHMGGRSAEKPSLFRMLMLVYEYNFTGRYQPEGSGGFTGKKCYLTLLVSNNKIIQSCGWSFRMFKLDFDAATNPWDIIDNLSEDDAVLYGFTERSREKRSGLWFSKDNLNSQKVFFYYREFKTTI